MIKSVELPFFEISNDGHSTFKLQFENGDERIFIYVVFFLTSPTFKHAGLLKKNVWIQPGEVVEVKISIEHTEPQKQIAIIYLWYLVPGFKMQKHGYDLRSFELLPAIYEHGWENARPDEV
jgi:hypothetical protein